MAAADVKGCAALLSKYKEHISGNRLKEAKQLLTQLKLQVVQFQALPPLCAQTSTSQQELIIARDMLEQSVLLAIKLQDDALFQRNFQQLSVYYTDMRNALPASELRPIILGLNLVRLLVSNRIADFHIELETLTPEDQAHACIAFPKQLEQALMEGTYRQVLAAGNSAPSPHMTPLLAQLAATVRDELAGCASAAYSKLLLGDAAKMLGFEKQQELLAYCTAQGWRTDAQHVHFAETVPPDTGKAHLDVFKNMLTYARELDRII